MGGRSEGGFAMTNTMSAMIGGWDLRVDRGPNWLLVRVRSNRDGPLDDEPLAERLWHLMDEHLVYRLALELDEVEVLDNRVIRQLGRLDRVARDHGGFVRLCGLSRYNWQRVVRNGLGNVFYPYGDRKEAVFAFHPPQTAKQSVTPNAGELRPRQGTRRQNASD